MDFSLTDQERERYERKLEGYRKHLADQKYALDQSSIVAVTDVKGTITYVNEQFCKISKYTRDELVGQNHRMISSGLHPKEFFIEMWKTITTGQVWRGEVCNKTKDGSLYWVYTTIVPFLDEQNRPQQYIAIRTDITDKKQAQQKLEVERAKSIHAARMAELGELAAGIAHEINGPLSVIQARIEMLQEHMKDGQISAEKVNVTMDSILRITERVFKIIRGLRSYARDGSNDPFEKVKLSKLFEDVFEFLHRKIKKRGVEVSISSINPDLIVEARESQIAQVFANVLGNAVDAAEKQDAKWVRVEVVDQDSRVQISVTDSGRGIDETTEARIFQPFFTTKVAGQGTGLGLSITKGIVDAHKGQFFIDRNCENTRFIIVLPKKHLERGQ